MSQMSAGILSAIAVSASVGVVQLASGHDLTSGFRAFAASPAAVSAVAGVNRAAKADRTAPVAAPAVPTQTISIHVDRVADTSVLVRIPRAQEARNPAPAPVKSEEHKATIACEPVVSVLTEIAKRLQPGRCVT
jgi:hypothetical protein